MRLVEEHYDVVVVGGGVAGVCAAIAAARHGCKTCLVQDRPVLGGNSSREIRVYVGGADMNFLWARESGIIEELRMEERFRNRHTPCNRNGWLDFMWDTMLYEAVKGEKLIDLFLNTSARRARTDESGKITAVEAFQLGTEKNFVFKGDYFIDASGDGAIAYDAGAEFMYGREGKSAYGESLAPEKADAATMGSSILFKAVDTGQPVTFVPPPWAHKFPTDADIPKDRKHKDLKGGYAWLESGGLDTNTISDNEAIRDELLKIVFGIWDHIKNQSDHGAANWALDWIGAVPGKRESRRFYGDYVLSQNDTGCASRFSDAVAYAGWAMDIHTPGGFHSKKDEPMAAIHDYPLPLPIPWRSLYSKNVPNLLLGGRNISASHIAFSATRVMGTCAIMGQAVGAGAALCRKKGVSPRELGQTHIKELQQQLLKDDCHIPGVRNEDVEDIARRATVRASSEQVLYFPPPNHDFELKCPHAVFLPVSADRIDTVRLPLRSTLDKGVEITARIICACENDHLRNESTSSLIKHVQCDTESAWKGCFASSAPIAEIRSIVSAGFDGELCLEFNIGAVPGNSYWLLLDEVPGVYWKGVEEHPHHDQFHQSIVSKPVGGKAAFKSPEAGWVLYRRCCLNYSLTPQSYPYSPGNVNNGFSRPGLWPNLWISDSSQAMPQWIELLLPEMATVTCVHLAFDTNLDILVELDPVPMECVSDYEIMARSGGKWVTLVRETGNHLRKRIHSFPPIETDRLKLLVHKTNGDSSARVYEIRMYRRKLTN